MSVLRTDRTAGYAVAALRIMSALVLLQHGLQKVFLLLPVPGAPVRQFDPFTRSGAAGIIEVVGSTLLALGLFTRATAFVLAGEMAFAYFLAHAPRGFFPVLNRGEVPVLLCFIFLALAAIGPGSPSLDGAIATRRRRP
jgi:putative oxidoreductase